MSFEYPRSGLNNVAEYQVSGLPWVTQSIATSSLSTRIDFPYVTQGVAIVNRNSTGNLFVGFTRNGVNGSNRFTLTPSGSFSADFKLKSIYVLASSGTVSYEVVASLTTILPHHFPRLTGSAVYPSGSHNPGIFDYGYGVAGSAVSGSGIG